MTTLAAAQDGPLLPPQAREPLIPLPPGATAPVPEPEAELEAAPAPETDEEALPAMPGKSAKSGSEPLDRDAMLEELYSQLSKAATPIDAKPIASTIETLWLRSGSDTIGLLMRRALKAMSEDKNELALKLLDAVVELSPAFAEGWNRRAYVFYKTNDYEHAVGDLRRALALEPNHYKALEGLGAILRESGQKKSALKVYEQILRIYPQAPGAKEIFDDLTVEVEGQRI
jgi:tetratricopeptide (TPR) repeat protein